MKKKYKLILVLLAVGITAFVVAYTEGYFNKNYSTLNKDVANFEIKDTASITKMVITVHNGKNVVLDRQSEGVWQVNEKFQARKDCINNLLVLAKRIKVRTTVSATAKENVIKRIAAHYKKLDFYVNGKIHKTYYIGPPSLDNEGNYMVLETPENGRSAEPYIMEMPGFSGVLDARVFTEIENWRFTGIYNYNYHDITQVKVVNHDNLIESFTLKVNAKNEISFYGVDDKSAKNIDTIGARGYLMHFQKLHYENLAKMLSKRHIDSMLLVTPYYTVEVTDNKKVKNKLRVYHMPSRSNELDLEGKPLKWNPERAYAIMQNGEAVVIQFFVFDKILRSIRSFSANGKPMVAN